ncbi:MAG: Alpha-L-glutamate ligase-like protein [Candidatus Woesebacteria bacterium GW2011_GWB1_38_8]|uniref:Alpha-L-glutamate ligase-like protein n=1 Tax=Candidatus Woesebacteria bacterium GW2011_GWB1_38_8 TaxID=1618570 RepID=A0A0G0LBW5_9BACT|nr:MAG: Alpha-L-glutamate ligase-like protein [Candidatus Woesebacteria bacterium GW2011_GWB1_38_8]
MQISDILGLNARTQLFSYAYNDSYGKSLASSKVSTKRALKKANVAAPEIYAKFSDLKHLVNFDWEKLPDAFALKPSQGLGGEGIVIVKKRAKDQNLPSKKANNAWITTQKKRVTVDDLKLHVMDILEGAYSMGNVPDVAYIEEYVGRHKAFRKFSYRGTPDIRVIVFNKVPVMAMLRLPTKESGGRANLHQGAIAVGIDMATGITVRAFWHGSYIRYKPETKRKLHGIKIPQWSRILETAVQAGIATRLGYFGADVVMHPDKGPMILELNSQPGLSIQLANASGLRRRLDRVKDLDVKDADHGVRISKILFAERFADRVKAEEGVKILKPVEKVKVYALSNGKSLMVNARIDTGAVRSSVDRQLAEDLGLMSEENILWRKKYAYRSAHGKQSRPVIGVTFKLAGRKIKTSASVANRSKLLTPLLIGRNDLSGYLIKSEDSE